MRFLKTFTLIILTVLTSSCEDFLEVEEVGRTSIPVFFSDMDGIRAALPGAYSKVYDYYDRYFMLYPDAASDLFNMVPTGEDTRMFNQFNYNSTPQEEIGAVGYIWRDAYEALANVNNILEYHPELLQQFPDDERELNRIKAEALFLRSLIHFDLVRVYAQPYNFTEDASHPGIPVLLSTPGPDENVGRSSVDNVYAQVISDLKEAETLFSEFPKSDSYHASTQSVEGLLARVYLYKEDWELAKNYATSVIDKTQLAEGEDYLDMFRTLQEGREAIFRLNGNLKGSTVADYYTPAGPTGYASQKLKDLFSDESDLRMELIDTTNSNTTLKYHITGLSEENWQVDLFVLRASEMYLIRAEANAQLDLFDEAIGDLKVIQARALSNPVTEIEIEVNNKEELIDLILDERAREFNFEGHRLFDLTRNKKNLERHPGINSPIKDLSYPNPLFILPIPETEINANENITQNTGY